MTARQTHHIVSLMSKMMSHLTGNCPDSNNISFASRKQLQPLNWLVVLSGDGCPAVSIRLRHVNVFAFDLRLLPSGRRDANTFCAELPHAMNTTVLFMSIHLITACVNCSHPMLKCDPDLPSRTVRTVLRRRTPSSAHLDRLVAVSILSSIPYSSRSSRMMLERDGG